MTQSMALRYFLDPAAPDGLRAVPLVSAHCNYWWTLYQRRDAARAALAACDDIHLRPGLEERLADSQLSLHIHYEICETCRAWLEELSSDLSASSSPPSPKSSDFGEGQG